MDTDTVWSATNDMGIEEGLDILNRADRIYGHKILTYDLPVLKKLYGFAPKARVMDTLVAAAFRFAHIKESDFQRFRKGQLPAKLIGKQSLEAWGYRLGVAKVGTEIEDWSVYQPIMLDRCVSDTAVNKALVFRLRAAGLPMRAYQCEHELAEYLFHQENNGWPFDLEKAVKLQGVLAAKREALEQELKGEFQPWFVNGGITVPKRNNKKRGITAGVPYSKLKLVEFNPGSRDHIANRLTKLYGWKPEEFTESGKPKVDENTLKGLDAPPVAKLREYLLVVKRLGQIAEGKEAWLKHATDQHPLGGKLTGLHHIHGGVIQNQAITHRASHVHPNIAQVPKVGNPYGAECRELFHVPA